MSKLIIVRGTASSGKSFTCKTLANELKDKFIIFPVEDVPFFSMLPSKYLVDHSHCRKGFYVTRDNNGDIIEMYGSDWANRVHKAYISTLQFYTNEKFNIICDGNFLDKYAIIDVLNYVPDDYEIYIFGLNVPLHILEEREKNRNHERVYGFARCQYKKICNSMFLNDLTVNIDSDTTNKQIIDKILYYYNFTKGKKKSDILERI